MAESALDFKINGNKNMDILPGIHGIFKSTPYQILLGGFIHTVISDYGDMLFQAVPTDFGTLWLSIYHIVHTAALSAEANAASLEAMHMLSGDISFSPEGLTQPVNMKNQHWQIMYLPYVNNCVVLEAGTRLMTLDFHYNQDRLEKLAPHFPVLDTFLNKLDRGKAVTLSSQAIPLPKPVTRIMSGLLYTNNSVLDQDLYIERHATDWLASELESPYLAGASHMHINEVEKQRMLEVYNHMQNNLSQNMTVNMLAKLAQMNEYKFSCIFKAMFNQTVHQFLIDERLKHAMDLLTTTDISLTEIANIVGYETQPAFTKKFGKKYGYPPSTFR